ncbi:MAG: DUF192 domain-containing protein [Aquificaceae bacterium]|nr:DUF192 domain-containing protein [Aquificaceae bacterium]MDW8236943.1 DUF192 domain-containing protein [Aquificaceae bacterium]
MQRLLVFILLGSLLSCGGSAKLRECNFLSAKTPQEHAQGLMHRRTLDNYDGMVFIYDRAEPRQFWNMNTHLDLILYWFREGRLIGVSELKPIETHGLMIVSSPGATDLVVELVRGRRCKFMGIELGSTEF